MMLEFLAIGLITVLLLGTLAAAAVSRSGYPGADAVAAGALGTMPAAVVAWLAYVASDALALLPESMPYAALCAIAGPHC